MAEILFGLVLKNGADSFGAILFANLHAILASLVKKRTIFELSPSDIQESWWGSFGQQRGSIITLRHAPTGLEVVGEVPPVHRTHRQLRAAEADLRARLMMELTEAVTKHLRIPGR